MTHKHAQERSTVLDTIQKETPEKQYCNNDPCETEAVYYYITSTGARFYLCHTCKEAFELGQVNAEATTLEVEEQ